MSGAPALSTENTLKKASAHLRWLVEKSGVDPEKAFVCIVVGTKAERDKIAAQLRAEHDPATMVQNGDDQVTANGVKIAVTVRKEPA